MFKKALCLAPLVCAAMSAAWAIKDPTQPGHYKAKAVTGKDYRLSSVIMGEQRRVAMINGKALVEGEALGHAVVRKIEKERVVLVHDGKVINLVPARTTVRRKD